MSRLVLVESPFAFRHDDAGVRRAGLLRNVTYARAALHDCFTRGELPWCSHLLYTQPGVLDDDVPEERTKGIEAGLEWGRAASLSAFYTDLGMSSGMEHGLEAARRSHRPCDIGRTLPGWREAVDEEPGETLLRLGTVSREELEALLHGTQPTSSPFSP